MPLVGPITRDNVYTHDYSDAATWPGSPLGASAWVLEPPPGYAYRLLSSEAKASTNIKIHAPLEIWFQAKRRFGSYGPIPPVAGGGAAYMVSYDSMRDWIRRGGGLPQTVSYPDNPELTKPILQVNFQFAPCPIIWSTVGKDDLGLPKWNRMIIRIADHQPYRDVLANPIEVCLAKYEVEIYRDQ